MFNSGNAKKKAQHTGGGGSSSVKREVDETVNVKVRFYVSRVWLAQQERFRPSLKPQGPLR